MGTPEVDPLVTPDALADTAISRGRVSTRSIWIAASAFWLLVFTIVVARAIYFEPGAGGDFSGIFALVNPR